MFENRQSTHETWRIIIPVRFCIAESWKEEKINSQYIS